MCKNKGDAEGQLRTGYTALLVTIASSWQVQSSLCSFQSKMLCSGNKYIPDKNQKTKLISSWKLRLMINSAGLYSNFLNSIAARKVNQEQWLNL